jgi:two-component system sensor histidine kinase UhpB
VQAERKARDAESRLEERRDLARLVEQKIEEERRLIAHELHDEFGQSVTAIRSLAEAISAQGGARDAPAREAAQLISAEAGRLYDNMHGLIPRLTPFALDTVGLGPTLESLVRDWQRRFPAVRIDVRHEVPADLGSSVSLAIYRIVQEGLINALRHAQASQVDIVVRADGERIAVSVRDDGVGLAEDWARPGHFGLKGLDDRVAQLGGRFSVANSVIAHGVELHADIPLAVAS